MFISTDTEKAFSKIHYPVRIKSLRKSEKEGNFLYIIKDSYKNPMAVTTVKLMNAFHIDWNEGRMPKSHHLHPSIILEILANTVMQAK